jgi:uncharacterized protein YihD (DUF1040 family)
MIEKARIQRILSFLETRWQQQSDVRFNQLISNLQHMYSRKKKARKKKNEGTKLHGKRSGCRLSLS